MAADDSTTRMNWGLTPIAYDGTATREKAVLFVVLCVAWVLPGLVGHDPWKADEAVVFGAVNGILQGGDWVAFQVAGEPLLDRAPLLLWVAAALAKLLGGILPLHDAARLASGLFMAVTLGALTLAARELLGERAPRMAVLLLLGCLGLLLRAHELITEMAGLAGLAVGLYGLALAAREPKAGGAVAGVGLGLAFIGDGFLPAGCLAASMAALPAASPLWRTRSHGVAMAVAAACALPLLALWPLLIAAFHPELLGPWLHAAAALPPADEPFAAGYLLRILPWYAWPAWPLAAWTLYRARRDLRVRRGLLLPTIVLGAFFFVTGLFGEPREVNALPLLLPLALLGVAELDHVPRGAASALDWFGMTTFFLFAVAMWICWVAAITGDPQVAREWLQREAPGFVYRFQPLAVALAALLTLVWLAVVARSLRSTRRALVNWTAGITMAWMLVMTLGLPVVDQVRSYRTVSAKIAGMVPAGTHCIARRNIGEAQRALLDYFAQVRTVPEDAARARECELLLVQSAPSRLASPGAEWREIWRGARPADRLEAFALYRRADARDSTISTQ